MGAAGNVGAIISGLVFGIAWWLFIDGAAQCNGRDDCVVQFVDSLPLVGETIFFILLVSFDWGLLEADDFEYSGNCKNISSWARILLFFYVLIGIGSFIGSIILMILKWSQPDDFVFFGIMQLLGTILIFASYVIISIYLPINISLSIYILQYTSQYRI